MSEEKEQDEPSRTQEFSLAIGAVASGLLTDLTSQLLNQSFGQRGIVQWVGYSVTGLLVLISFLRIRSRTRRARRRRQQAASPLHAAAEEAEQLVDEIALRGRLRDHGFEDVRVADLACAAQRVLRLEAVDDRLDGRVRGTALRRERLLNFTDR